MAARVRQERFFAAAKAKLVRRGEWARPKESEAAVGWNAWDPPVDADQVHVVPSLLGITLTSRWHDSDGDLEDEDVLFGGDPADPGPEADDDDDLPCPRIFENSQKNLRRAADQEKKSKMAGVAEKKSGIFAIL